MTIHAAFFPLSRLVPFATFLVLSIGHVHAEQLPIVAPEAAGLDGENLAVIPGMVQEEIEKGNLPGAVVIIGRRNLVAYCQAFGHRQLEPTPEVMTTDTVFDMASITKPVATATSVMVLVQQGKVRLRDRVSQHLPEFAKNGKEEITVEHLLTHQGGLIPDNRLSDYDDGPELAWQRIWELEPMHGIGKQFVYTDVGFLVLGKLVEQVSGKNIAEFAAENIFGPLEMNDSSYLPAAELGSRIAPTEKLDGNWLRGNVHDPRAARLNGIAGHAGLFSSAHDLALYANMMLTGQAPDGGIVLSRATIGEMTTARDVAGHRRGLGWDMRSKYSSNRGEFYTDSAFGHGGFTGTAMWIDPELDLFVIFLSSRLHPDGVGQVNHLAGRIGTVAAAAIVAPNAAAESRRKQTTSVSPSAKPVLLGIDVLAANAFKQLAGQRVALITNHTGNDRQGRRTIDLLHEAPQVELVSIFSPEHGLQGKLDQSNISDSADEKTGLPVRSLYGKSRRPEASHLEGLDTLVFDIQDIGTRFYTYISTMGLAMEAAAEQGLKFVVLDRPNPLGGIAVEGPVLDLGKESFVGYHPISIRHGMTIGELALMFKEELALQLDLKVIRVEHWRRAQHWDQTGLLWTNPSPNMRSITQAFLYPGIGILETTNVSVGRGTDTPFEVVGAPWIDGRQLAKELNAAGLAGVRFVPIRFTPDSSKHADKLCEGVNIAMIDRNRLQTIDVGLQIACTLRKLYSEQWDVKSLNRLLIDDAVYEAILAGETVAELKRLHKTELEEFQNRRNKYLIYQ